jgi:hypothetical protein
MRGQQGVVVLVAAVAVMASLTSPAIIEGTAHTLMEDYFDDNEVRCGFGR